MAEHEQRPPLDPSSMEYRRRAESLHLESIENRMLAHDNRLRALEDWRLGATAMIDSIPRIQTKVEQQERTDAIEAGVAEGLRKAEVRGWGKTERRLALLGGAGIVASLALQLAGFVHH